MMGPLGMSGEMLTWLISGRRQGAVLLMTTPWVPPGCSACSGTGVSAALHALLASAGVSA